jgi:hypothetical protein
VAYAAVRGGGDQAHRVEHRAAAHGDDVGMAVEAQLEQLLLHALDEVQLGLDLLAAGHRHRRARELEDVGVALGISADCREQHFAQPVVHEEHGAVAFRRLEAAEHVPECRVLRVEYALGEHHGELVRHRKALPVRGGTRLRRMRHMRYVLMLLGLLMVAFAVVQYNDPDGLMWACRSNIMGLS